MSIYTLYIIWPIDKSSSYIFMIDSFIILNLLVFSFPVNKYIYFVIFIILFCVLLTYQHVKSRNCVNLSAISWYTFYSWFNGLSNGYR